MIPMENYRAVGPGTKGTSIWLTSLGARPHVWLHVDPLRLSYHSTHSPTALLNSLRHKRTLYLVRQ